MTRFWNVVSFCRPRARWRQAIRCCGVIRPGRPIAVPAAPHAEKLGWRLGCQAYSFNQYTFWEAIDKTASLGLRYIEAYPGQQLSAEKSQVKVDEDTTPEVRREIKKKLADAGVKLVNYGVCGLSKNEAASRKTFEFAKDMGIETIVSEPEFDAFDTIEKLCDEYQINVALHNHPQPSKYWNPDTVLEQCQGRSKRIGACADTGHWMRSGLNPVEQLKKLEGRIISFHFKDLNQTGGECPRCAVGNRQRRCPGHAPGDSPAGHQGCVLDRVRAQLDDVSPRNRRECGVLRQGRGGAGRMKR